MTTYSKLTTYKKEDFLEVEILKYLQKTGQIATRSQLAEYLVTNVDEIPNDSLKYVVSKKTGHEYQPFMRRLSFALTSLYKAGLVFRPKRGNYELTEQGKNIDVNNTDSIHQIVLKGWGLNKKSQHFC